MFLLLLPSTWKKNPVEKPPFAHDCLPLSHYHSLRKGQPTIDSIGLSYCQPGDTQIGDTFFTIVSVIVCCPPVVTRDTIKGP